MAESSDAAVWVTSAPASAKLGEITRIVPVRKICHEPRGLDVAVGDGVDLAATSGHVDGLKHRPVRGLLVDHLDELLENAPSAEIDLQLFSACAGHERRELILPDRELAADPLPVLPDLPQSAAPGSRFTAPRSA